MANGFYAAKFQTPMGMGGGVVHLTADNKVLGGDSTIFYVGTYTSEGDQITASVKFGTHLNLPGHSTVFGVASGDLSISGKITGDRIVGTGSAAQVPGVKMQLTLTRISG